MHDFVLGFVCFMAGALFVVAVGFVSLGRMPVEGVPKPMAGHATPVGNPPPIEPPRPTRGAPDPHPAWPECDCPTEEFHTKYYPSAGVA